jgi:hypothetical protein
MPLARFMPKKAGRMVVAMTLMLSMDSHRLTMMMWLRLLSSCMCQMDLQGGGGCMGVHRCARITGRSAKRLHTPPHDCASCTQRCLRAQRVAPKRHTGTRTDAEHTPQRARAHTHTHHAPGVLQVLLSLLDAALQALDLTLITLQHLSEGAHLADVKTAQEGG